MLISIALRNRLLQNPIAMLKGVKIMKLINGLEGKEYIIKKVETEDEEIKSFLFTLGCYEGEPVTIISHLKGGCVISLKDSRYNIDNGLAEIINV